jgi:hypothetical protein
MAFAGAHLLLKDKIKFYETNYRSDNDGFFLEPCPAYSVKLHDEISRLKDFTRHCVGSMAYEAVFSDKSEFLHDMAEGTNKRIFRMDIAVSSVCFVLISL